MVYGVVTKDVPGNWKHTHGSWGWTYHGERADVGGGVEGEGVAGLGGGAGEPALPHILHCQLRPQQAALGLVRDLLGNVEVFACGTTAS